jgi:hypothetical protein
MIKRKLIPLAFWFGLAALENRTHLVSDSFSGPRRRHAIVKFCRASMGNNDLKRADAAIGSLANAIV